MNPYQYYPPRPPSAAFPPPALSQQPLPGYYAQQPQPQPLPASYLPASSVSAGPPVAYTARAPVSPYDAPSRDTPPVVRYFNQPAAPSSRSRPPAALLPSSYPPPSNPELAAQPSSAQSARSSTAAHTQTAQGLQHLLDAHCPQQTPESIGHFVLTHSSVSPVAAADWLTQPTRFHQQTLSIVLGQQDYTGLTVDQALLLLLATLDPRSDTATERVLYAFAGYYYSQNAGLWVGGDQAVLSVATALMAVWRGLIDRDTFVNDVLQLHEPPLTPHRLHQMYDSLTAQRTGMREEGKVQPAPAPLSRVPVKPLNLSATPLSFSLTPPPPLPLQQTVSSYPPLQPPAPLSHMTPAPFTSQRSVPLSYQSQQSPSTVPSSPLQLSYRPPSTTWTVPPPVPHLQQHQSQPYLQYETQYPPSRPMTPITSQQASYHPPALNAPLAHSPAHQPHSATAAYSAAAGIPQPQRAATLAQSASAAYALAAQRQQQLSVAHPPPPITPTSARTTPVVASRNDQMLAQPLLHQSFQPANPAPAYPLSYPPPSYQATFPSAPPPPSRAASVNPLSAVPTTRASSLFTPYPPPLITRSTTMASAASSFVSAYTPSAASTPYNPASVTASMSPLRAPSFDFQRLNSQSPAPLPLSSSLPAANPAYTATSTHSSTSTSPAPSSPSSVPLVSKMSRKERKAAEAAEKERKKEAERREKEVELEGLLVLEMHVLQEVMEWRESGQDDQHEEKVREPTLSTLLFPSRQEKGVREEWMGQLKELERKRHRLRVELGFGAIKGGRGNRPAGPLSGSVVTTVSVETFEYLLSSLLERIDDHRQLQGVLLMLQSHCLQMQQRKEAGNDDLTPLYAAVTSPHAMHVLLLILMLYAKDETVTESITRLLFSYASIDPMILNALLDNDMLTCLLAALDNHTHRPAVVEPALRFCLILSSQQSHQHLMVYHQVHTFCLDLLSQHDIGVIDAAGTMAALCLQLLTSVVSVSQENRDKLVQANALSVVIERISRPGTPLELVMDGLQCLDTMTVSFTLYLAALSSDQSVHALLSLCTANPTVLALQRQCVSILLRLCDHNDENKQRMCLASEGDVGLLLACINNHGEHEDITMTCCILLSRLLAFRQSNARLLGNVRVQDVQDGIHAIMPILHKHLYSPSLQLHATSALYHFLCSLPLYRLTLADGVADGLVEVLARALHMYVSDTQHVRHCCACLLQLIIFFPAVGDKLRDMKVAQELQAVRQHMKQQAGGQSLDSEGEECLTVMNTLINVIKTNGQTQSKEQAAQARPQPVEGQRPEGQAEVVGQEGRERRRSRRRATPPAPLAPISLASARAISAPHEDVDLVAQYWEPLGPERRSSLPPVHALNLTLAAEQQVILVPPASLEPPLSSPHQTLVSASSSFLRPDFRPSVYLTLSAPVAVSPAESKAVAVATASHRSPSPVVLQGVALLDVIRGFRASPPPSSQLSISLSLSSLLQRWCAENDDAVLGWERGEPVDDVEVLALSLLNRLAGREGSEQVQQFQQRFVVGDVTSLTDDEVSRLLDALLSTASLPVVQEEGKADVEAAAIRSAVVEHAAAEESKEAIKQQKEVSKEKARVIVEVTAPTKHIRRKKRDEPTNEADPRLNEARRAIVSAIQSLKTSTPAPWQLQSLHALLSLTSSTSPTALPAATLIDLMMAQRTSATIIRSMRRLESNSDIQRLGCALLCFLASSPASTSVSSSSPASYRLRLSDEGAIECAVNALQLDSDTAQQALALLSSLLSAASIAAQVKRTSVVSVVYIVMRRFARDVRVQRWGVQCVRRIADVDRSDSSMAEPIALAAITNALTVGLEAAEGPADLLVDACDVLAWLSLCRRDSDVGSHYVELVCQLLERSEEAVQRKACEVLKRMWELARRKKPLKERMEAAKAMERVASCESEEVERERVKRQVEDRQERVRLEAQAEEERLRVRQAEEAESRKQQQEEEARVQRAEAQEQTWMEEAAAKAKREMQLQRQQQPLLVTQEEDEEEDEAEEEQHEVDEVESGATTEEEDNHDSEASEAEADDQQQQPLLSSQLDSEALDGAATADELLSVTPMEAEETVAELNDSVHSYEVVEATTPTAESFAAHRASQRPPASSASLLSAIRNCVLCGGAARIDGDEVLLMDGMSLPRKSSTAWRYRAEYLTVDSIVFFLSQQHVKLSEYIKACSAAGVQVVPFAERAALLDFLQGETDGSEYIDVDREEQQQQATAEPAGSHTRADVLASPSLEEDSKEHAAHTAVLIPIAEVVAAEEEADRAEVSVVAVSHPSDSGQRRKRQSEQHKKKGRAKKGMVVVTV